MLSGVLDSSAPRQALIPRLKIPWPVRSRPWGGPDPAGTLLGLGVRPAPGVLVVQLDLGRNQLGRGPSAVSARPSQNIGPSGGTLGTAREAVNRSDFQPARP